jgi:hypothetical protein
MRLCASFPPSAGSTAMPILCVEGLRTQERWNPEVAIILGAAARYRRATAGRSHGDLHPYSSALHTGAVRPHTGYVGNLFFISPRTGHGSSQVFEMLPAFSCLTWVCVFRAGDGASIYTVGPPRQRRCTRLLSRRAGSSGVSWKTPSLVKKTLHRHRAGFEPQRALSFRKWVKSLRLGEAARA